MTTIHPKHDNSINKSLLQLKYTWLNIDSNIKLDIGCTGKIDGSYILP